MSVGKELITASEHVSGSTVERIAVTLDNRTVLLEIETFPDGKIGDVSNLLSILQERRLNPKEFSEELGKSRPMTLEQFMDTCGDILVEEMSPPFEEAIATYKRRHGKEKLARIVKEWMAA